LKILFPFLKSAAWLNQDPGEHLGSEASVIFENAQQT